MSKFKVGDRVRVTGLGLFDRSRVKVGDIAMITRIGEYNHTLKFSPSGQESFEQWHDTSAFELASRFSVGDRVICTGAEVLPFGKTGRLLADDGSSVPYLVAFENWRDGNGRGNNEWWLDEDSIATFKDTYTSCAAAEVDNLAAEYGAPAAAGPKFKVGDRVRYTGKKELDFDKTMMGKTGTVTKDDGGVCVGVDWDGSPVWSYGVYRENLEHVAVAPATATAKFKIGDRVKFRVDYNSSAAGKSAKVVKVDNWGVQVQLDGTLGVYGISTEQPEDLVLLPTSIADIVSKHSQTGTAIVCLLENGKPAPATQPFVHGNADYAAKEATRLANVHKGKEFGVYTLGAVAKVERTYDHEWQRLAAGGQKISGIRELRAKTGLGLATAKDAVEDWLRRESAASLRAAA